MKALKSYNILFSGLKNTLHHFDYTINDEFLKNFTEEKLNVNNIKIGLDFDKNENFIMLDFQINGIIKTTCDRCLDPLDINIDNTYQLVIKFEDTSEIKEEDEIIFLPLESTEINVAKYIYEYLMLSIPSYKTHSLNKSSCNPEIVAYLHTEKKDSDRDPRWDKLFEETN